MNLIKFYRVETLPENGEVGSLYFVHNENNNLYICTKSGFEDYTTPTWQGE